MMTATPTLPTEHLLGYPVHPVTLAVALKRAEKALENEETLQVVTLNPEMIMQGEVDPELGGILKSAGLILPDGAGVVWALRHQGSKSVTRLPGIEFSEALLKWAAECGQPVALIGAKPEILASASQNLAQKYPGLPIVFEQDGFFTPADDEAIAQACAAARPSVVLVALGVPRQEKWIATHKHLFTKCILVGVGGSLDVWSGTKSRAPAVYRHLNLEWFYRIASEPWRLKRTYKTLPMFVVKVLLSANGS